MATGIETRHARGCRARGGGRCSCTPTYQAHVFDKRSGRRIRRTFARQAEAKTWRQDALIALRSGTLRPPSPITVREAARTLNDGMGAGAILDRSGKPYKPSTCRSYEDALDTYIVPRLGELRLAEVQRRDVQDLVEDLRAAGLAPSTIHNTLDPLRVLFRRALDRDELTVDPTRGLKLPAVRNGRDRIESPVRAQALIEALPEAERAFWSLAFFAALRRGELMALRWRDVDFDAGVVRVERGWDPKEGEIEAKSHAGLRSVPMADAIRRTLAAHKLRTGRSESELVVGRTATLPFVPSTVRARARKAWAAAGLEPLTPHEARHCAVSYFIACGMNPKQISVYVGHGDVRQTWNRYGHLMPGDERQAAALLDGLLGLPAGSECATVARQSDLDSSGS